MVSLLTAGRQLVPARITHSLVPSQPAPRSIRHRSQNFDKNITKRGMVSNKTSKEKEKESFPVSKALIAFFLIVVVGSSIVQILNLFDNAPKIDD